MNETPGMRFLADGAGQDLTEYGLLLAFVAIAGVVIFLVNTESMTTIWDTADHILSNAYHAS